MEELSIPTPVSLSHLQVQALEQLNDEEFWLYANSIATMDPPAHSEAVEYLVCNLEKGRCLLPLAALNELVPPPYHFTQLPATPRWMLGLVAWRNEPIAVVDLEAYLWDKQSSARSNGMLLVAQHDLIALGLFATTVGNIETITTEQIVPLEEGPGWCSSLQPGVARAVNEETLLLDLPFILNDILQHLKE